MGMKHHATDEYMEHPNGSRSFRTAGPFASLAKVERCPCEDGRLRTAFATAESDSFWSVPACAYVGKKTVGGRLEHDEQGWRFVVDRAGKNAVLIPAVAQECDCMDCSINGEPTH